MSSAPDIECLDLERQSIPIAPSDEGAFFEIVSSFYQPENGRLVPYKTAEIKGGNVVLSHYSSRLATHNVNIYIPEGHDPKLGLPAVVMFTPWLDGTGKRSHSNVVAQEMMRQGLVVVLKGVPHYSGPKKDALTFTEEANEMMGIVNQVEGLGIIEPDIELLVYGESQAAQKGLGVVAVQNFYDHPVSDGQLVAFCFAEAIDWSDPLKASKQFGGFAINAAISVAKIPLIEKLRRCQSFRLKDAHHHAIAPWVITSGEAGTFFGVIDKSQKLGFDLGERDGISDPLITAFRIKKEFPEMRPHVFLDHGHIDVIMSEEVRDNRNEMISRAIQRVGVEPKAA